MSNRNNGNANLVPWKKGQSGNPKGRPKRKSMIELLNEHIDNNGLESKLVEKWLSMLMSDDFRYFKEYLERRDGKVKDEVEVTQMLPEVHVMLPEKQHENGDSTTERPTNRILEVDG